MKKYLTIRLLGAALLAACGTAQARLIGAFAV